MKYLLSIIFMLTLSAAAGAQEIKKDNRTVKKAPGSVSGEIVIKDSSGNGLTKFTCSNLVVGASKLGGGWHRKARAIGEFTKHRCMFMVPSVPAGDSFVAVLGAQMPSCDQ